MNEITSAQLLLDDQIAEVIELAGLTAEDLSLVAGGECVVNSI